MFDGLGGVDHGRGVLGCLDIDASQALMGPMQGAVQFPAGALAPRSLITGEEGSPRDVAGDLGERPGGADFPVADGALGPINCVCGHLDVDPGLFGQAQVIAPEGTGDFHGTTIHRQQECPQFADDGGQGAIAGGGCVVRPDFVDEFVARDRAAVFRGEHGEREATLPPDCAPIRKAGRTGFEGDVAGQVNAEHRGQPFPNIFAAPAHDTGNRGKWNRRVAMGKIVQCDCGFVAKAESDEELIAQVQRHAKEVHDMDLTAEQVLAMAHPE